jgi:hypothetical protein
MTAYHRIKKLRFEVSQIMDALKRAVVGLAVSQLCQN